MTNKVTAVASDIAIAAARIEVLEEIGTDEDIAEAINGLTENCIKLLKSLGRKPRSERIADFCRGEQERTRREQTNEAMASYRSGMLVAYQEVINYINS